MDEARNRRLVAWVATEVMPHEPAVRAWLNRRMLSRDDVDDLVQEAYCRMASADAVDRIERPDGYFFQIVRNLLNDQLKRANVVRIDSMASLDELGTAEPAPGPEVHAADRRELGRIAEILDSLPERCRRVFELRRLEGLPQRTIAERLGITEAVVENEGTRGIRLILQALRDQGGTIAEEYAERMQRRRWR